MLIIAPSRAHSAYSSTIYIRATRVNSKRNSGKIENLFCFYPRPRSIIAPEHLFIRPIERFAPIFREFLFLPLFGYKALPLRIISKSEFLQFNNRLLYRFCLHPTIFLILYRRIINRDTLTLEFDVSLIPLTVRKIHIYRASSKFNHARSIDTSFNSIHSRL